MNSRSYFWVFVDCDDDDDDDDEEVAINRIERKQLRDKSNPLTLNAKTFKQRFRLNKAAFSYILNEINLDRGGRRDSIPPILKLCATLSLLSSGSYQSGVGNDYVIAMSQSTISKVTSNVITILENKLCSKWIKFQIKQDTKQYFFEKFKLPGIIGCIDGTHINLLKPVKDEHVYFNRKGRHSLNAMIICDHELRIMAVNARYGGCSHDSFVWKNSNEREFLASNDFPNTWLLGDSGYPLEPWLITPYRAALDGSAEINFNNTHSKARSIVERNIGVYKGRWRILLGERQARYHPEKMASITNVCAALHNICIAYNIELDPSEIVYDEIETVTDDPDSNINCRAQQSRAQNIRNTLRDVLPNNFT